MSVSPRSLILRGLSKGGQLKRTEELFLLSVLECVRKVVVGHKRNEERFVTDGVVYILLDMLESSLNNQSAVCDMLLRTLADVIATNEDCALQFVQWNSATIHSPRGAVQMLLETVRKMGERPAVESPLMANVYAVCETLTSGFESFDKVVELEGDKDMNMVKSYTDQWSVDAWTDVERLCDPFMTSMDRQWLTEQRGALQMRVHA
ncbi:unnamed protein product [Vitrella brassicaformis CCMP3155]|uniref:Uncharacterized protein n=1 Tax=Vitrella brassicaformis (strain CCMP3155) TaxID=1169540 RepID=A0A0G4E8W9_VITBC|nr:unnamed protein product [Vitrella brassicaformis CCMP3155]|eukprot:CEL91642.1 unnamed protein product [Vitrella brassicaformis CCMP3155]